MVLGFLLTTLECLRVCVGKGKDAIAVQTNFEKGSTCILSTSIVSYFMCTHMLTVDYSRYSKSKQGREKQGGEHEVSRTRIDILCKSKQVEYFKRKTIFKVPS